jgi:hypothetical protein
MDLSSFVIIVVAFCIAIWANHRTGYLKGVTDGHLTGIYDTIDYLKKNNYLKVEGADSVDWTLTVAIAISQKLHEQREEQRAKQKA